jgi:superfamily II DNA helicase RecQ
MGLVFDEAHCITSWGEFRSEYKELECLQYILPCYVPFMIVSATLMADTLQDVKSLLHMRSENLLIIHISTD